VSRGRPGGFRWVYASFTGSLRTGRSGGQGDLDLIAYEMTLLAEAAGAVLTPGAR
jgi:hypothetical protein